MKEALKVNREIKALAEKMKKPIQKSIERYVIGGYYTKEELEALNKGKHMYYIEIYESRNGYRWRIKSKNGEIVQSGENYKTEYGCTKQAFEFAAYTLLAVVRKEKNSNKTLRLLSLAGNSYSKNKKLTYVGPKRWEKLAKRTL
tara:strand:+ start:9918 stop:10349 length:432 start_codon:yes stop_codon:yes gene_type:complete